MIILIIIGVIFLYVALRLRKNANFVCDVFKVGNVGVNGKKRKGKDFIFQMVISMRKEPYYSNIEYGGEQIEIIQGKDLQIDNLTYERFINNDLKIYKRRFYEGCDIYWSDGGNYFPSQYQKLLVTKYPSMSIFLSLQGQLYGSNSHFNWNGESNRIWDKIKEQMDNYFRIVGSIHLGIGRFVFLRYYDRVQSFEENKLPFKKNKMLDSRQNKALRNQYEAEYGIIKNMWVWFPYKKVSYDTRYFEKLLFGEHTDRLDYYKDLALAEQLEYEKELEKESEK